MPHKSGQSIYTITQVPPSSDFASLQPAGRLLTCARGPRPRGRDDVDVGVERLAALERGPENPGVVQVGQRVAAAAAATGRLHVGGVHAAAGFVLVGQVVGEGRERRCERRKREAVVLLTGEAISAEGREKKEGGVNFHIGGISW